MFKNKHRKAATTYKQKSTHGKPRKGNTDKTAKAQSNLNPKAWIRS